MNQLQVRRITVTSARFIPLSTKRSVRKRIVNVGSETGDLLAVSGTAETFCTTEGCRNAESKKLEAAANENDQVDLQLVLEDGTKIEASATLESYTDTTTGKRFVFLCEMK